MEYRVLFWILVILIGAGCISSTPQESLLPQSVPPTTPQPVEGPTTVPPLPSPTAWPSFTAAPTPTSPPGAPVPEILRAGPLLVERLRAFSNLTSYLQGGHFRAEYRFRNMGNVTLENITAEISFTSNNLRPVTLAYSLEEAPRTQVIPSLGPGEERHIFWLVYAWKPGDGDVLLEVRSAAGVQRLSFSVRVG